MVAAAADSGALPWAEAVGTVIAAALLLTRAAVSSHVLASMSSLEYAGGDADRRLAGGELAVRSLERLMGLSPSLSQAVPCWRGSWTVWNAVSEHNALLERCIVLGYQPGGSKALR